MFINVGILLIFAFGDAQKLFMIKSEDLQHLSSLSSKDPEKVSIDNTEHPTLNSLNQENSQQNISTFTILTTSNTKETIMSDDEPKSVITKIILETGNKELKLRIPENRSDTTYFTNDGTLEATRMENNIQIINYKPENNSNINKRDYNYPQDNIKFQTPIFLVNISQESNPSNIKISDTIKDQQNSSYKVPDENDELNKNINLTTSLVMPIATDIKLEDESSQLSQIQNSIPRDNKITVKISNINYGSQYNENTKNIDMKNNSNVSATSKAVPISITFSNQSNKQRDVNNSNSEIPNARESNKTDALKLKSAEIYQELDKKVSENVQQINFEKGPENSNVSISTKSFPISITFSTQSDKESDLNNSSSQTQSSKKSNSNERMNMSSIEITHEFYNYSVKDKELEKGPENSNVSISTKSFPISITFSTQSDKESDLNNSSSQTQNRKSNSNEIMNMSSIEITHEFYNYSVKDKELEKRSENSSNQLIMPIAIQLTPNTNIQLNKDSEQEVSHIEGNNGNVLLLRSTTNYNPEPIHLIDDQSESFEKVVPKDSVIIEPKENFSSHIVVEFSPSMATKKLSEHSNVQDTQHFDSFKNSISNTIYFNMSQNDLDKGTNLSDLGSETTADSTSSIKSNNQLNSITIELGPAYGNQANETVKPKPNSQIFNTTIYGIFGMDNMTESIKNDMSLNSQENNNTYQRVTQANNSTVMIPNLISENSTVLRVLLGSNNNINKEGMPQSEQRTDSTGNIINIPQKEIDKLLVGQTVNQRFLLNISDGQFHTILEKKNARSPELKNSVEIQTSETEKKLPSLILLEPDQSTKIVKLSVDTSNKNTENGTAEGKVEDQTETQAEKEKVLINKIANEISSILTSSPQVKQSNEWSIINDTSKQNPSDKLNDQINPGNANHSIQEFMENYGSPNIKIFFKNSENIPELILGNNIHTSKEKLLITTSKGDKIILYDEQDNKNNDELKNVEGSLKSENQSPVENTAINTGEKMSQVESHAALTVTQGNRNTDKGPLWWVSTDSGFAPGGGAQALKGFVFKIEGDNLDDTRGDEIDSLKSIK